MQVNNVSMNTNKPAFTAGISHNLYKKITAENQLKTDIFEKIDDISKTNYREFVLTDVVFDAKNKIANFVLSAVDNIKFITGLENVKPKVVKSSGENIEEAFKNINMKYLEHTNSSLASDYKKAYEETRPEREKLQAKRRAVLEELKRKFETADGFWNNYYRSLDKRK